MLKFPQLKFPQQPIQKFLPALQTVSLLLATLSLNSWVSLSSSPVLAQAVTSKQDSTKIAQKPKKSSPSPVLAATTKPTTDWWVPGILGGSVVVGGVGVVLMLKRSQQSLVTEAPEPILYNPDLKSTASTAEPKITAPTPVVSQPSQKSDLPKLDKKKKSERKDSSASPSPAPSSSTSPAPETESPQPDRSTQETQAAMTIAHPTTRMPKISVMDVLVQDLRSQDPEKRKKAIWELGRRGDSRAVQPLVDLLLDSDSRQRSLVLSALSEISTRTLKPMSRALAISMQDENADVRKNAIRDLTRIYETLNNISNLLQSACEDPDVEVQETAKWAIGQINRIKSPLIQGAGRSVSQPESLN